MTIHEYFNKAKSAEVLKEVEDAKQKIADEFISKYYEFLADVPNGESNDFGWKYGFKFTDEGKADHSKDTIKNLCWFQSRVFSGRFIPEWEKAGYSKYTIWELSNQGFLSWQEYSNWQARATGRTSFYYISQKTAKEIYKARKGK